MDFDWSHFESSEISQDEIAESFEDAFCVRLLPDSKRFDIQNRFLNLGRSSSGKGIFVVYTSTGKVIRIVAARPMTDEETLFYERKAHEQL